MLDTYEMYQKMYLRMFNAATDALRLLDTGNVWDAKKTLMDAQCDAEEIYISAEEGEENDTPHLPPPIDTFDLPGSDDTLLIVDGMGNAIEVGSGYIDRIMAMLRQESEIMAAEEVSGDGAAQG